MTAIIGGCITGYGYFKYGKAQSMISALRDGDALLGNDSSKSIDLWSSYSSNYKLMLIIGAVILVIGIILLISGLLSENNSVISTEQSVSANADNSNNNISERLGRLEELKKEGMISEAEYEEKRKELISSL